MWNFITHSNLIFIVLKLYENKSWVLMESVVSQPSENIQAGGEFFRPRSLQGQANSMHPFMTAEFCHVSSLTQD